MNDSDKISLADIRIENNKLMTTVTMNLDRDDVAFYASNMPLNDQMRKEWFSLLMRMDAIEQAMKGQSFRNF